MRLVEGGTSKVYTCVQGGGGQKLMNIERTYLLNGPVYYYSIDNFPFFLF